MSKGSEIHCYDYVNHPYEEVRAALIKDALSVFQSATKAAASRAQSVASELRVDVGGIAIGPDIRVSVKSVETISKPANVDSPIMVSAWVEKIVRLISEYLAA